MEFQDRYFDHMRDGMVWHCDCTKARCCDSLLHTMVMQIDMLELFLPTIALNTSKWLAIHFIVLETSFKLVRPTRTNFG